MAILKSDEFTCNAFTKFLQFALAYSAGTCSCISGLPIVAIIILCAEMTDLPQL